MPLKLATEAPINGGPNYEGPKVNPCGYAQHASLSKTELYAGKLSECCLVLGSSDGLQVTIRQTMGAIRREGLGNEDPSETNTFGAV